MCTSPLFAPPWRMTELTPFLPPFFHPPEISPFWWTSIAITLSGNQGVLPTPAGRKYSTGSSPLTSSSSMTLTHSPFYIALLAVAPLLTSPLLPLLLPFLVPGRCFRTWVLTTYQFIYLSLSPRSFAPTSVPLPSIFRKLWWLYLLLWLSLSYYRGILVSFSLLCCCSLYLSGTECVQIFHSFQPHQTPS